MPKLALTHGPLALALLSLLLSGPAMGQTVDDVFPLLPEDGALVGVRPQFRIGIDGNDLLKMQFRIELSRDGFRTIDYTFDSSEDRMGWGALIYSVEQEGAMYVVRAPLAGGAYEWRAAAWNGLDWIKGQKEFRLIVDDVPPAQVEQLRLDMDREKGIVTLNWQPVLADANGLQETVTRYHIYRANFPVFFTARIFELGTSESNFFDHEASPDEGPRILFYRVAAEDAAGNQPEVRQLKLVPVDRSTFERRERERSERESRADR